MTPFDIINSINEKKPIDREEAIEEYAPFIINRGLSMHAETVHFANEMNHHSSLSKDQQFDFYMNAIPKGKRWGKWAKADKIEQDVANIQTYFEINRRRAEEILSLFTASQLSELKDSMNKGGSSHGRTNK